MSAAVPAQATGRFREHPVPPPLREAFACMWVHELTDNETAPIIVSPDGTIDLQWIAGKFRVAGPDRDPAVESLPAGSTVIGFRFRPAAAHAWLGVPAIELVGQRLPLEELWGFEARRLADDIHAEQDIDALVNSISAAIAKHAAVDAPDHQMSAAYLLIEQGAPPEVPIVPWLMRALAMSERTLRRRFNESFGYGPKTLERIFRYQRFLRLSRQSKKSTAALAMEAGYSDQAHLVRESRRLTRYTPGEIQRLVSANRDDNHRTAVRVSPL